MTSQQHELHFGLCKTTRGGIRREVFDQVCQALRKVIFGTIPGSRLAEQVDDALAVSDAVVDISGTVWWVVKRDASKPRRT
jgi:hypothetical protein